MPDLFTIYIVISLILIVAHGFTFELYNSWDSMTPEIALRAWLMMFLWPLILVHFSGVILADMYKFFFPSHNF
jgi:hypothetical protein